MPPRPKKQVQQGTEVVKSEFKGPNQDPIQQLVTLVVRAYEEGIDEGRKSKMTKAKVDARKGEVVTQFKKMKEVRTEEDGNEKDTKSFKRKWDNNKDKPEGSQSKKFRTSACANCRKKHFGVCLKGKGVCYHCQQTGHMSPQCPKRVKGGCFGCGANGHQFKKCPHKKEKVVGKSFDQVSRVDDK